VAAASDGVTAFGTEQRTKVLLLVAAASDGVTLRHPIGHQSTVACGCCSWWCYFLAPNSTEMLSHVAAANHGVADVSSHIGAVPHLQPDAMVQGLHFTMFLSLGRIFVCAFTICC